MTRAVTLVLVAVLLTTGLATLAPAASAEKMCLTVQDTIYFYLKYYTGSSWGAAYAALSKLDCPGIFGVLCTYGPFICAVDPELVPDLHVVATVWEEAGFGPTGHHDDRVVGTLPPLERVCVGAPGTTQVCLP